MNRTSNPRHSPCVRVPHLLMLMRMLRWVLLFIGAACVLWLWHVFVIVFMAGVIFVLYFWFHSIGLFKDQQ